MWEKQVMRISRRSSAVQTIVDQKRLENVECEYFSYLGSLMSSDMRVKLNSQWPWRKQHLTKRKQFSPANWTQM
jgi:hypothetical protein